MKSLLEQAELYCITAEPKADISYEYMVEQACIGGAQIVQFRYLGDITDSVVKTARNLRDICQNMQVLFIINNYPDMAKTVDADGVHIGQGDISIVEIKRIIGCQKIVGISAHSYEQAMKAQLQGADYIGFGPVFATPTKPTYPAVGLTDIGNVVKKIDIPLFIIGGITMNTIEQVISCGAERVAVVRAVCGAPDIAAAATAMRKKITQIKKELMYHH